MNSSINGYCACSPASTSGTYVAASAFRAEAAYSRTSDIVIETLEGDRVTLSSSAYAAGGFEAYDAFAMGMGAGVRQSGTSAYSEAGRKLSLSVSGDLNAEELGDIDQILKTLEKMMNDLMAGDLESALAGSEKLSGVGSIASFSADMRVTASVAVSHYEATAASIPMHVAENEDGHWAGRIDRAADRMARRVNAKAASMGNLVGALEKHFSEWFETRTPEGGNDDRGMKWASRYARRLMDGIGNHRGGGSV